MPTNTPLLIVTAGAARGRTIALDKPVTIGRDEQNTLPIADPVLSRRHCIVDVDAGRVVLKDLGSKNGVFVNGCPVTERALEDRDEIRIGDSALVVSLPSPSHFATADPALGLDDRPVLTTSTIALDAAVDRYFGAGGGTPRRREEAADLRLLVRFAAALQHATTLVDLHDLVLVHALEAAPADAVALLTRTPEDGTLRVVASKSATTRTVSVSQASATRALTERVAVLAAEVSQIAVPLETSDDPPLVLCLTGSTGPSGFDEDSLRLVTGLCALAALAAGRVRSLEAVHDENRRLRQDAAIEHNLVGESVPMQSVYRFISRVAPTESTVLIRGESGTGKELLAHAIHVNSARAKGPFVAINCAALPDALLESELFGHERGAFTGALSQQRGRLELAHRGTVFLDEIGELAPALQAKLLRVLEDQIVERLGARRGIQIDVRVVAATNRDLDKALATGTFRQDLYYRLNVVSVTVPPLRERRDDVPLLAAYFVRKHAARCKRVVRGLSPAARALLLRYDWPGNVRELSNAIERAVVLGSTDVVMPEDLPEALGDASASDEARGFHGQVAARRREIVREALQRNGGNVAAAARELGLQVTYLHRLIRLFDIRRSTPDQGK